MKQTLPPPGVSVYRGQARSGIGEGPGQPISQGEQYLAADPELAADGNLLRQIRPWMSLDADPADLERLGEELEAWSCFGQEDRRFVARLTPAGIFDRRPAYFTHGRGWTVNPNPKGFDPGTYLGHSEAFDRPWREPLEPTQGSMAGPPELTLVRPQQVRKKRETAQRFLAHLLHCRSEGVPLIIAAPLEAFVATSELYALVSFARAALPLHLKRDCRVRAYTRNPELFLSHLGTDLLIVPQRFAPAALAAQRDATLLDHTGEQGAGATPGGSATDYAAAVTSRALDLPGHLLSFSERFSAILRGGLEPAEAIPFAQVVYDLTYAQGEAPARSSALLADRFFSLAQELGPLPWEHLLPAKEEPVFPRQAVVAGILRPLPEQAKGEAALRRQLEAIARAQGWQANRKDLASWWSAEDPDKIRRFLELQGGTPPEISPLDAAQYTSQLTTATIASLPEAAVILEGERQAGLLHQRSADSLELARAAQHEGAFAVLAKAEAEEGLTSHWSQRFLESKPGPRALINAALAVLNAPHHWAAWGDLPARLLDRLLGLDLEPGALSRELAHTLRGADPVEAFPIYLRLAELSCRTSGASSSCHTPWPGSLEEAVPLLKRPASRELAVQAALNPRWRSLEPSCLEVAFRTWDQAFLASRADAWLAAPKIRSRLPLELSLQLASLGDQAAPSRGTSLAAIYHRIDEAIRSRHSKLEVTGALIRKGWWYFWRQSTGLGGRELHQAALIWLDHSAWLDEATPEATLETWLQVIKDLEGPTLARNSRPLSGLHMSKLCRPHSGGNGQETPPAWPWIPPFETDQIGHLSTLAGDFGALEELAQVMLREKIPSETGGSPRAYVLESSGFQPRVSPEALSWLQGQGDGEGSVQKPPSNPLTLEEAKLLSVHCGHLQEEAQGARIEAILHSLRQGTDRRAALAWAEAPPNLWQGQTPRFLTGIASWLAGEIEAGHLDPTILQQLETSVPPEASSRLDLSLPPQHIHRLSDSFPRLMDFLVPGSRRSRFNDSLRDRVVQCLSSSVEGREGREGRDCWRQVAQVVRSSSSQKEVPILARAAAKIRSLPQGTTSRENWWETFETVASGGYEIFLSHHGPERQRLPALDLALAIFPPGAAGCAALAVTFSSAAKPYRNKKAWWQALLRELRGTFPDNETPDRFPRENRRPDLALAVLLKWSGRLNQPERNALDQALESAAAEWPLIADFGVSPS